MERINPKFKTIRDFHCRSHPQEELYFLGKVDRLVSKSHLPLSACGGVSR